ncbi:MAG: ABC transporter ATP-binding protein [Acidimicrobiales bacterium]
MLELDGLHRRYGEVVALDGLSFAVPSGKVTGFLGPNGAGKTTAMRAVFGVTALDGGEVRWNDRLVGPDERSRFGYMPEERGLYPGMRVAEQLEYLGRLHGMARPDARAAAGAWAERLGLGDQGMTKVESLSLGNQQRVQLAAALVHSPELLVLDEPFSGLDPVGVDTMSEVLAERAAAGVTVLFSSHQLDLVEHLCEAVAIVYRGKLVAQGSVEDLSRGGHPSLVVAVGGDPEGRWALGGSGGSGGSGGGSGAGLGGLGEVRSVRAGRVTLALSPGADPQRVLDIARAAGPVEHFAFERRRLSEVFREAVGADVGAGTSGGATSTGEGAI